MNIKKPTGPKICRLCLQDAEAEVARHVRENRPCNQPGCPLRDIINEALEKKQRQPAFVIGQRTVPVKPHIVIGQRTAPVMPKVTFGKPTLKRNRSPNRFGRNTEVKTNQEILADKRLVKPKTKKTIKDRFVSVLSSIKEFFK